MEILNTIDPQSALILLGMVAGVVELIKRIFHKDWEASITIACSGVVGALSSIVLGINPLLGAVAGLAASGYITIAQHINKQGD